MKLGFLRVNWHPCEGERLMRECEDRLHTGLIDAVRDLVETVVSVHAAADELQGKTRELAQSADAAVIASDVLGGHADEVDTSARAMIVSLLGAVGKAELVIALASMAKPGTDHA